jgi:general secretion pathway protein M
MMKALTSIQNSIQSAFQPTIDQLQVKFEQLQPRERIMLVVMSAFLLVVGVGGAVWGLHQAADRAQARAADQHELLLWMRSQAQNVQLTATQSLPLNTLIQTTAQQQNLNVSQTSVGDQIQVTVTQQNYAVLGAWLSRLAEQGVSISQLSIEQQPSSGDLQLKAVLALSH